MSTRAAADRELVLAFLRSIDRRASTRVERFRFGAAYFNERLPVVWDRNFVAVEEALGEDARERLEEDVERLQGGAGLEHRKLVFDAEPAARAIGPLLAAAGWELRRVTLMVHDGSVADPDSDGAREVAAQQLRSGRAEMLRPEGERYGADAVRQVLEADELVSALVSERCFASFEDATPVAWCRLFSQQRTAQIEDVATIPGRRRRGHATAAVTAALRRAVSDHDLTFLLADDARWLRDWYARLGFESIGERLEALREPPAQPGAA